MANINTIINKYLEAAMPDGIMLTLDTEFFMKELSRNIDIADRERKRKNLPTCAGIEAIMAQNMKRVERLGASVFDGGMVIKPDVIQWLDELIGPQNRYFQVVPTIRSIELYKNKL